MKDTIRELKIGAKINVFEREGYETEEGNIINIDNDILYIKWKNASEKGIMRIPINSIKEFEINIFTKANNLDKYKEYSNK